MKYKSKYFSVFFQLLIWFLCFLVMLWIWNNWYLSGPFGDYHWAGMDLAPFWVGVNDMLHRINPYQTETLVKIQQLVYGGAVSNEDPMMFVYPAWLFILILPFALLPFSIAVVLYTATLMWALFIFLFRLAHSWSLGNLIKKLSWFLLLTFGSLPFIVISVTKGQLGYIGLISMYFAEKLWGDKPKLSGILLAIALIKPTVIVIPIAAFLIWAMHEKKWDLISYFFATISTLLLVSLIFAGNWIPDYLNMLKITGGMPVLWSLKILHNPYKWFYFIYFLVLFFYGYVYSKKYNNKKIWIRVSILLGIAITPMRWIYDLFLGILIPSQETNLDNRENLVLPIAIISPWFLSFIPTSYRWNSAVIGLPLIWSIVLIVMFIKNKESNNELKN